MLALAASHGRSFSSAERALSRCLAHHKHVTIVGSLVAPRPTVTQHIATHLEMLGKISCVTPAGSCHVHASSVLRGTSRMRRPVASDARHREAQFDVRLVYVRMLDAHDAIHVLKVVHNSMRDSGGVSPCR